MPRTSLEQLLKQQQMLEERLRLVEQAFAVQGVSLGVWLSPADAAKILGVSRDRILWEIKRAEDLRLVGKKGDVRYNEHYRNIQNPEAETATWQVNLLNMQKIFAIPPEQRRVG